MQAVELQIGKTHRNSLIDKKSKLYIRKIRLLKLGVTTWPFFINDRKPQITYLATESDCSHIIGLRGNTDRSL